MKVLYEYCVGCVVSTALYCRRVIVLYGNTVRVYIEEERVVVQRFIYSKVEGKMKAVW